MREPVALRTWFAIGFVLLGIAVIASEGLDLGSFNRNLAALLTTLVLGTSFALARRYRERNVIPAMTLSGLISALLALPLSFRLIFLGPRYIPAPEASLVLLLDAVLGPYWVWAYPG